MIHKENGFDRVYHVQSWKITMALNHRCEHEWISGYGSSGLCLNDEIGISTFSPSGFRGFNSDGEGQGDSIQRVTPLCNKNQPMFL
ncbi:hypothetical protein PV327_002091 [Microctonus hyperodae]|uniref:Uncharacterized protein n=1 Tax=Microctonus hyperodae TaxID=165561 RepID=A0AA39KNW2_MICHY|nr:hypothetical protein PV327_002091 [Microctonus hyperodae]